MSSASQLKVPLSYKWVINNPKACFRRNTELFSPSAFSTSKPLTSCGNVFWKLFAKNTREVLEVGLYDDCSVSSSKRPSQKLLISELKYSVLDPLTDRVIFTKEGQDEVVNAKNLSTQKCMLFMDSQFDRYIIHKALTIKVSANVTEVSDLVIQQVPPVVPPVPQVERPVPLDSIRKELHTLYKDQVFTDVIIKCGGKEFKAHKIILAAQSPVFKKMFLKESQGNLATISDIDPTVLGEMLGFIYSGEALSSSSVSMDKDLAKRLLKAADMYQIPRLVTLCANEMQKKLTVNDVVEVLMNAHTHDFTELKTACLRFIHDHAKEVKSTSGWSVLKEKAEQYSTLLVEIMDMLAT